MEGRTLKKETAESAKNAEKDEFLRSMEILGRITEIVPPKKETNVQAALERERVPDREHMTGVPGVARSAIDHNGPSTFRWRGTSPGSLRSTLRCERRLAEGEGFEPPVRSSRTHDFESRAFNHSATPPWC